MEISWNLVDASKIAHAVQCSSFNKLAGWHSDERWSELVITCSFADISKLVLSAMHLILCGCHITCNV